MTPERGAEDLILAIEHANQTLDWIEKRDGPLPSHGYARIETTVQVVRALRGVALKAVEDGAHAKDNQPVSA